MAHPPHDDLGEGEGETADDWVGVGAADQPGEEQKQEEEDFEGPLGAHVGLDLLEDFHVLLRLLGGLVSVDNFETGQYSLGFVGVEGSEWGGGYRKY